MYMFKKIRGLQVHNEKSVSFSFSVLVAPGQRLLAVSLHRCFVQTQGHTCVPVSAYILLFVSRNTTAWRDCTLLLHLETIYLCYIFL